MQSPFKTLEAARDAVRALGTGRNLPVSIYLREGIYEIQNSFSLDEQDSGSESAPITYASYPGERAILSGSKSIDFTSFEKADDHELLMRLIDEPSRENLVAADLSALGLTDYGIIDRRGFLITKDTMPQMELLVDGSRQTLARWPNEGFTTYNEVIREGARTTKEIENGCVYSYTDDRISQWKTNDIFVSGVLGANYSYDYYPIGSIDADEKTVTLKEGAIVPYYSKHFFHYENVFEEIDSEGEYYIDRQNGKLYFYPPKDFSQDTKIRVTYLQEPMIRTNGTDYVRFLNLTLEGGRDSGIISSRPESLEIIGCNISNFGRKGVQITNGKNSRIANCTVTSVGNTAITVGGGDYVNLTSSGNIIENNEISKPSYLDRAYSAGILLSYQSVGAKVLNNKIYDAPHTAIIIYGPEHQIEYNEIFDVVKEFHDMDAIYMNVSEFPWERGVVFRRNYIHDIGRQEFPQEKQMNVAGIRSDNGGHGLLVEENVFANIGRNNANAVRGVCALGTYNVVRNNIFVDTSETFNANTSYDENAEYNMESESVIALKNQLNSRLSVYGEKYPMLYRFFDEHPRSAQKTNVFENNLIVNIKYPLSTLLGNLQDEGYRGSKELVRASGNYITTENPGFIDYHGGNFTLTENSEVFEIIPNFPRINLEEIGKK